MPTPSEIYALALAVDSALDQFESAATSLVEAALQRDSDQRAGNLPDHSQRHSGDKYSSVKPYLQKAVGDRMARIGRDTEGFHPPHQLTQNYPAPTE